MMTSPGRLLRSRGMGTACIAGALSMACAADPRVGREAETVTDPRIPPESDPDLA